MNNAKKIISVAQQLKDEYQTTDPFELCHVLGIKLSKKDLDIAKGFYLIINKTRVICLNTSLDYHMKKLVCFHEIGHDQLHRDLMLNNFCFKDFEICNMQTKMEVEANIFASEFILPTEEIIEYINSGYDIFQIGRRMYSDYNLVLLKIAILVQQGYDLKIPLDEINNNFLM